MVAEQISLSRVKIASKRLTQEPALHGHQGDVPRKVLPFWGDTKEKREGKNFYMN